MWFFLLWSVVVSDAKPEVVIGIDLGTTYSCVGILRDGKVEIIPNEQGNRITPSYVAFTNEGRLVGDSAKNQLTQNPTNTVYDVKRLIGRAFSEGTVQSDLKKYPFKVKELNGRPVIEVMVNGESRTYSPEEISGMVLGKMKETAEKYLGEEIRDAIVTVPAYFNDGQRQATKDAGRIAGLNVLRIINEPTAAAIAYGVDKKMKERNVLVYDLGGGTFDVTLLTIDEGVFEVLATSGDTHLGGEDFDQNVLEHFLKILKKKHGVDIRRDHTKVQQLRREVEKAKRTLSSQHVATIEVEDLLPDGDYTGELSRALFQELNMDLFRKTFDSVRTVLDDATITPEGVDEIILVGGSTRIPKIRQMVSEFFGGRQPITGVNPDEAVAQGAAYQASVFTGAATDLLLLDVTPLSLGIETMGDVMSVLVPKNTVIPTKKTQIFSTAADNQPSVDIKVYQGERTQASLNSLLGDFLLSGIPPAPRGQPQVEVTFELDANSILLVTAQEKSTGKSKSYEIKQTSGRLSKEEIDSMIRDAESFSQEDKIFKEKTEAFYQFESTAYQLLSQLKDDSKLGGKVSPEDKKTLQEEADSAIDWLSENKSASLEDIKKRLSQFEGIVHPITSKLGDSSAKGEEL